MRSFGIDYRSCTMSQVRFVFTLVGVLVPNDEKNSQGSIPVDWTVDPQSNHANSSPEFLRLVQQVGEIIRHYPNRPEVAARFIMAQLAHVEHLVPAGYKGIKILLAEKDNEGNLNGVMSFGDQIMRFTTQPLSS